MKPTTSTSPTSENLSRRTLAERLEPTTQAVTAAHDARLHQALGGVRWERRGLLGRLTRADF